MSIKTTKKQRDDLLEVLSSTLNCEYISDLKKTNPSKMIKMINKIDAEDFSIHAWEDAAEYLSGEKADFHSQKQAKDYLQQKLSANRS